MNQKLFLALLVFITFFSCQNKKKQQPLFTLVDNSGIKFTNAIYNTKDFNIFSYRNYYNGGGVGIGDINNDGLADVFFTANMGSNKLYLNKGDWQFDDISVNAGIEDKEQWSTGVVMVDINADGWLDIYVCNAGYMNGVPPESKLYINNHDLTFTEEAEKYGLTNKGGYTTHAAFFDYDIDGDLDVFIINNSFIPVNTLNYANKRNLRAEDWPVADFLKGGGDHLLRNDNGKFTDVSKEAGIYGSLISFGLGVTVADVNGDHYPDVYVSNDFFERDYLYINQKNGTFKDEIENYLQHTSLASMGADMADINNDGYPDILVTDMLPDDDYRLKTTSSFDNIDVYRLKVNSGFYHQYMQNTLQLNNGNGKFMDIAHYSGVAASDWSWGGLMFDADNDGLTDIYICNGIYNDVTDQDFMEFFANDVIQHMVMTGEKAAVDSVIQKMPSKPVLNKAFRNTGNLKFSDAGNEWGFTTPSFSNGAAYGDLDNDGDLDLIINNVNQPAFIYRNNNREQSAKSKVNHFIGFQLKGNGNNTFAIGSQVKLFAGEEIISRDLMPSRGFQSSVDYKILVGLGDKKLDSVQIIWPDHSISRITTPVIDSVHVIQKSTSLQTPNPFMTASLITENKNLLFSLVNNHFISHQEDDYTDFYYERNIPVLLSREGPQAAVADVNGDGMQDVYIGGAANQPGQLYIQTAKGFELKQDPIFETFKMYEDVAVLFFDADKDGDQDLFVGSGGNNYSIGSKELQNRLYINDGKGNFTFDANALPANTMNTATVAAHDFDNDGDLDLFVGSHSVPGDYGTTPVSMLLLNNGKGKFIDISKENPGIQHAGMITGATWADVNGDHKKELIIIGEWIYPKIFSFSGNNKFTEIKSGLETYSGLWQTVLATDLDNDGDVDLVLGNIGENFYLEPGKDHPVKMWMNDFDKNGMNDKIITRHINGKDVPVFMKREITEQLPGLKKKNLRNEEYARSTVQDLFSDELIKDAEVKHFNYPSSSVAINDGKGNFTLTKLPAVIQFSCVNAITAMDVNNDGLTDLVTGGNKYGWLPQFGRLDADYGNVLLNKGNGKFVVIKPAKTGLNLLGEIRSIQSLKIKGEDHFLMTRNNDKPLLFTINNNQQ